VLPSAMKPVNGTGHSFSIVHYHWGFHG